MRRTIESALQQTYAEVEIVLYDDGSTDQTPQLAASYGQKIRYLRNDNRGIAVARTAACKTAMGEYIAFLDDDDLMPADRLSVLHDALVRYPEAKFAVGEIALIDAADQIFESPNLADKHETLFRDGYQAVMWPHFPATVHTTLFRRRDGEAIGWFDESFRFAGEDKDFFARLAGAEPVIYVPKVVSLYRRGHDSLTRQSVKVYQAQLRLFKRAIAQYSQHAEFKKRMLFRIRLTLQHLFVSDTDTDTSELLREYCAVLSFRDKVRLAIFVQKQRLKKLFRLGTR